MPAAAASSAVVTRAAVTVPVSQAMRPTPVGGPGGGAEDAEGGALCQDEPAEFAVRPAGGLRYAELGGPFADTGVDDVGGGERVGQGGPDGGPEVVRTHFLTLAVGRESGRGRTWCARPGTRRSP